MTLQDVRNTEGQAIDLFSSITKSVSNIVTEAAEVAETVIQVEAETTLDTITSVPSKSNTYTKDISYQILMEPLNEVTGAEGVVNNLLEFLRTHSQAFLDGKKDELGLISNLSNNPNSLVNENVNTAIDNGLSANTLAAQSVITDQYTGKVIISPKGGADIISREVHISSDNNLYMRGASIQQQGQNVNIQSNNMHSVISNFHIDRSNTLFQETDSQINRNKDSTNVSSNSFSNTSKEIINTGVNTLTNLGNQINNLAEQFLNLTSNGDIQSQAVGNNTNVGSNINIIAREFVPNVEGTEIAADSNTESIITEEGEKVGNIFIGALTQEGSSIFSFNQGNLQISNPKDTVVINNGEGQYRGENMAFIGHEGTMTGTPKKATVTGNRGTFINTIKLAIPEIVIPFIEELPPFPTLPKLPTEELEKCIPDKFKRAQAQTQTSEDDEDEDIEINLPSLENNLPASIAESLEPGEELPSNIATQEILEEGEKYPANATDVYARTIEGAENILKSFRENILETEEELESISLNKESFFNETDINKLVKQYDIPQQEVENIIGPLNNILLIAFNNIKKGISIFEEKEISNIEELEIEEATNYLRTIFNKIINTDTIEDDEERLIREKDIKLIIDFLLNYPQANKYIFDNFKLEVQAIGLFGISLALPTVGSFIGNIFNGAGLDIGISGIQDQLFNIGKDFLLSKVNSVIGNTPFSFLTTAGEQFLSTGTIDLDVITKKVLDQGLSSILPSELSSIKNQLQSITLGLLQDPSSINLEQEVIKAIRTINPLKNITNTINQIVGFIEQLVDDYKTGDIKDFITGTGIRDIVTAILGQSNNKQLDKIFYIIEDTLGTVEAIRAVPELLELMDEYGIPTLDQINIAINCLDLFNKIDELISNFKGDDSSEEDSISNRKDTTKAIENLPRVIQGINSINVIKNTNPDLLDNNDIYSDDDGKELIDFVTEEYIRLNLDKCFRIPKLTISEADINVISLEKNYLYFSVNDLLLVQNEIIKTVAIKDEIYGQVDYFINSEIGLLRPYQTNKIYTPSIYKYMIYEYDPSRNLGIAIIKKQLSRIQLQDQRGYIYEFSIEAIGDTLTPVWKDIYLNK